MAPTAQPFAFAGSFVTSRLALDKDVPDHGTFQARREHQTPKKTELTEAHMAADVLETFELPVKTIQEDTKQVVVQAKEDVDENEDEEEDEGPNDDYAVVIPTAATPSSQVWSSSQKKRADYDAFDSWLVQNRDDINKITRKAAVGLSDENKTSAALVREFESAKIIESPRDYQIELFERAKKKNIIAVLDTGSGKTLIAALLLRHTLDTEMEDRERGKPHRTAFFLVDKVALVFQQHAVLECNLSQPVAKFSGDKTDLRWSSKDFWDKTCEAHMVIVCTADILLKCLHHSYVTMDKINLLIFDEAHHTKKNHAYARIIKDFYASRESSVTSVTKPKIFGMTASPVDARTNITQAAQELESLLHSEIATIAHNMQLQSLIKPKKERVVHYHMALTPSDTELMEGLERLVGSHRLFAKNFQFAYENHRILGSWIIDRYWQLLFRTEERAKQEARAGIEMPAKDNLDDDGAPDKTKKDTAHSSKENIGFDGETVKVNSNVVAVQEASRLVELHKFPQPSPHNLSNKVKRLHDVLMDEFTKSSGTKTRCIVFVEQRYTAFLLADLFQQDSMKVPNLKTGALIGGGSTDMGRNSFRTQLLTISKFKRGIINCLFATSVAEEGLDIPDCNLVIRFDLYKTMIQYVQSRGRARQQESTYIHMAELGNMEHSRLLTENKASETKMREFCNALPEDRKIVGNDYDMEYFLRDEVDQLVYTVPSTKAKLTYRSSLVIVDQYVSTLPEPSDGMLKAEYSVFSSGQGFVCEVTLPSSSPIRHATGRPHAKKQVAKCGAAFALCLQLYKHKYIDKHLQPIFASRLPTMRNARLAVNSKKQARYKMRAKPEAWSELGTPSQLYAALLMLRSPESMDRPSRPVVLLTRSPIPALPEFMLYYQVNRSSKAKCIPLDVPFRPTQEELDILTNFSLRAFHDVFSKDYDGVAADMPYFLAPCTVKEHNLNYPSATDVRTIMDWPVIRTVASQMEVQYCKGDEPDEYFTDKFVADPFDGSRKFFMCRVRRDMSPFDPVPEGVPPPSHRAWNRPSTERNIMNYSVSLWSKSRAKLDLRKDQPVVEAEIIYQRRNLLDDRVHLDEHQPRGRCFLVLDTLRVCAIPTETVTMLFSFPPIIFRIESTMIAMEATVALGLQGVLPGLALEAVTKDSDVPDDYIDASEGSANFKAGMGKNYERLELLGDSFLKMASTIALYTLVPDKNEFEYHVNRMCMICNKNLFNNAIDVNLHEYVRSREFDRSWYPPVMDREEKLAALELASTSVDTNANGATGDVSVKTIKEAGIPAAESKGKKVAFGLILKKGKKQSPDSNHELSDKSIADVCEAMIGAAYLTTYEERDFDLAVRAVSAVIKSKFHPMQAYDDYFKAYVTPDWQTAPATAAQVAMAKTVARDVGYTFKYPRLLRCAVMHPSYPRNYENLPSYQRLEFLGDSLFDMAAVDYLFHKHPDKDPQWLTEHKMAMVSNQFLGALSVTLGFHKHLLSFTGDLQKQVMEYVVKIEDARARAEEEAVQNGKPPTEFARDYWVHVTRPVKVVADMLEAYIGAIFVDSGYDYYGTVIPFFEKHVLPYFEDMTLYDTFANKHPVTFAVKLLSQRFGCRDWRAVVQETPDTEGDGCITFATKVAAGFLVHGRVLGHGIAESGRYAKIAAAKQATAKLDNLSVESFRVMTGCNCNAEAIEAKDEETSTAI